MNQSNFTKPRALMCFVCGREFGTASLEIHMRQCISKNNFKGEIPDNYVNLFEKLKSGKKLNADDYDQFNNKANDEYKENTLVPCPICARRFLPDRLEIHSRSCKNSGSTSANKPKVEFKNVKITKAHEDPISDSTKLLEQKLNNQLGVSSGDIKMRSKSIGGQNTNPKGQGFSPIKPKGPVFLICYICGREFGKHSIVIHIEQCMEKHIKEELNMGIPQKQIKKPSPPNELIKILEQLKSKKEPPYEDIYNYNQVARSLFSDTSMKQCNKCGRKFLIDRLEVHLKSCNPSQIGENAGKGMVSRPRMLMCPLCGREYGSKSLDIHIKTCKEKFEREQQNLPRNLRKSAEDILEKYRKMEAQSKISCSGGGGNYNIDKLNNDAFEVFNNEALVPCELCGRTFLPDRLVIHARSCKGPKKKNP